MTFVAILTSAAMIAQDEKIDFLKKFDKQLREDFSNNGQYLLSAARSESGQFLAVYCTDKEWLRIYRADATSLALLHDYKEKRPISNFNTSATTSALWVSLYDTTVSRTAIIRIKLDKHSVDVEQINSKVLFNDFSESAELGFSGVGLSDNKLNFYYSKNGFNKLKDNIKSVVIDENPFPSSQAFVWQISKLNLIAWTGYVKGKNNLIDHSKASLLLRAIDEKERMSEVETFLILPTPPWGAPELNLKLQFLNERISFTNFTDRSFRISGFRWSEGK